MHRVCTSSAVCVFTDQLNMQYSLTGLLICPLTGVCAAFRHVASILEVSSGVNSPSPLPLPVQPFSQQTEACETGARSFSVLKCGSVNYSPEAGLSPGLSYSTVKVSKLHTKWLNK